MLKVENLTFEVNEEGKKRCLVNHVSFQVEDGEMLVITGPNGGGKSTLAKVLAGIEKADNGEIYLDGENITENKTKWSEVRHNAFDRCLHQI